MKVLVAQSCLTLCDPIDCSQVPLSMGFSRQESWSGLPFPSAGELPDLGIKPGSPALQPDSLPYELPEKLDVPFIKKTSLVAQLVKNPPAMRETWIQSLGWEDPLEKGMATHSRILA